MLSATDENFFDERTSHHFIASNGDKKNKVKLTQSALPADLPHLGKTQALLERVAAPFEVEKLAILAGKALTQRFFRKEQFLENI